MRRAALIASMCAIAGVLVAPASSAANHRHVAVTGNGSCVVLAKQGGEPFITLPDASFNNTSEPISTANPHPLHVHVHRGMPGEHRTIAVLGSDTDPCAATGNYLNGP